MVKVGLLARIQPGWWEEDDSITLERFLCRLHELSTLEFDCRRISFSHVMYRDGKLIGRISYLDEISPDIRLGLVSYDGIIGHYRPISSDIVLQQIS